MVAYRSRQYAFENRLAATVLLGSIALLAVLFTVAGAWSQAPWLCGGTIVLLAGLLFVTLTVTVDEEAVRVSLARIMRRDVALTDIRSVERRDYHPVREFGGWGLRWAFDRRATAYTTSGTSAVVLALADGSELYLGVDDEPGLIDAVRSRIEA
ncbi:hypothetical protein [Demequina sp. NBRC 110053]|uniref:hypothetical protein n=1 Tax=Demequina sp. NBRC 110053 TaxID=1570342 RepID=UPI0009FF9419|nr:hypothetical protein [Demequina sp. NBRC 110053]